jgi:hypothetical protein
MYGVKKILLVTLVLILAACSSSNSNKPQRSESVCLYTNIPNADYEVIRNFKVGKGTFGSVDDILPRVARTAKNLGADAIINYKASQRFGFWPWRFVRPVGRGTAVKWKSGVVVDCKATGGTLY